MNYFIQFDFWENDSLSGVEREGRKQPKKSRLQLYDISGRSSPIEGLWQVKIPRGYWVVSEGHRRVINNTSVKKIKFFRNFFQGFTFVDLGLWCKFLQSKFYQEGWWLSTSKMTILYISFRKTLLYHHSHWRVNHHQKHDFRCPKCHLKYLKHNEVCLILHNHEMLPDFVPWVIDREKSNVFMDKLEPKISMGVKCFTCLVKKPQIWNP